MKMNFKNKIFHQVYDKSFYRDGKRKRWEEKRSRKINRHFVNPILLLPKITLESITIRKHIFYDIRNDFFSVWYCTVSNHLLCNRLMIRIVASSRHGVPNISLQVSFVSMKFQNFDRRSFHVDTTNFVTYDPTSLDLGGRLLKRKKNYISFWIIVKISLKTRYSRKMNLTRFVSVFLHTTTYVEKKNVSMILYFRNTKIRRPSADQFKEVKKRTLSGRKMNRPKTKRKELCQYYWKTFKNTTRKRFNMNMFTK